MKTAAKHILVLGSGNFGTALVDHLASLDELNSVLIYARNNEIKLDQ